LFFIELAGRSTLFTAVQPSVRDRLWSFEMIKKIIAMLSVWGALAAPAMGSWSFVTLSDTYSGMEWGMALRVGQLFTHHDNIAFIVSTGNFENNQAIDGQFQNRLSPYYPDHAHIPWFQAFGNHNTGNPSDANDVLNVLSPTRLQTQLPGISNFKMGPHDPSMTYAREGTSYAFDYGNAHFVIINQYVASDTGTDGVHEQGDPQACVYDQWFDWLARDLAQNSQPIIFVFGHEPAFPRAGRHCGESLDEESCSGNTVLWSNPARPLRDKFWELLNRYHVVAHVTGHTPTASARVIKDLSDFPGIHRKGPGDYYCDPPDRNCYCKQASRLPEIGNYDTVIPSQGVIEYNNGISRHHGDFHVIEINGDLIKFNMYKDVNGALSLVRTFFYDATSIVTVQHNIYVDHQLDGDCLKAYSPANRTCGTGTDKAYRTIADAVRNTVPADTVFIRSGTYHEVIRPRNSGRPNAPITIQNYQDEAVTITNSPYLQATRWGDHDGYRWGIYAWEVEYITIEGIRFNNPGHGWGRFVNANHMVIKACEFRNAPAKGDVAGLKFVNSHHNQLLNNRMDDGFDNLSLINSNHNLVQGNRITRADNALWAVKCGDYNIFSKNYFCNDIQKIGEIYDCNDPGNADMAHFGILHVNATAHNVIEDNVFAGTAADNGAGPFNGLQLAGQNTIVRRNVIYQSQGTGIGLQHYASEAQFNLHNRIYNNVFSGNAGGAIVTGSSQDADHFADNIVKNNIIMNNRGMALGWADNLNSGHQLSHRDMANFLIDRNNIFTDILSPDHSIYVGYDTRVGVSTVQEAFSRIYVDNVALKPSFVDIANYNFRLQEGSPMIDAGKFLTSAVGSGSLSNQLVVTDAAYFSDGFGLQKGDMIQFENQTQSVQVIDIDYATNTLTLSGPLSWGDGDGVSLKYYGSHPDMGASETGAITLSNQAPATPDGPSATPDSSTVMALAWTASDNLDVAHYNIYRCSGDCTTMTFIDRTGQTTYRDTHLAPATQYIYQLSAVDMTGNESGRTAPFLAVTQDSDDMEPAADSGGMIGGCFIDASFP
jgi:hypothetical protein